MTTLTLNNLTRRQFVAALGATGALAMVGLRPSPALALTDAQATKLINSALAEVNAAIASGKTGAPLYAAFEQIFIRYADVDVIARSCLGPAARSASAAQMKAFIPVFRGYISRKYGRRFREFQGSRFEVKGAKAVKSYYEVETTAYMKGEQPFEVLWHVSDKSGRNLFFNIIIEGVNMLAAERTEVGALLDKAGGNIDKLTQMLKTA